MLYPPKPEFSAKSLVKNMEEYQRLYQQSIDDPETFWAQQAKRVDWFREPDQILDADFEKVDFNWFDGGVLNACFNAVDRHARSAPDKAAIIWAKNEPGQYQTITFRELKHSVARVANVLKAHGVKKGDRVILYLPMIPELAYSVLACARIGAVHSVVFAGFSAESLRDRILDCGAKIVITANEGPRGAKAVPTKAIVDDAINGLTQVETVLVAMRTGTKVPMKAGRDFDLNAEMADQRATCPVEWMASEDPLFILYTSGSTGKPKGVLHTTAGYLVYAVTTHQYVFDVQPNDVHFCTADIGWITGHTYILYGPLSNQTTSVMYEGVPNWPDPSRIWQIVDDVKATNIYTAPTALRALIREGDQWVKKSSRRSLRFLGTVGEPINPEVWRWYHDVVGEGRLPIIDTWWQTETGAALMSPLPGATPTKPGSATFPLFGIKPVLVDEEGREITGNGVSGNLCIARPWPGMARTVYGNHKRFVETYFTRYPGLYFTGDGCRRDEDGYYWITGRVDDVINVSGHRLGTAEVESALVSHAGVAEAAVVGIPHEIKGTGIYAFVTLKPEYVKTPIEQMVGALKEQVRHAIGPIATPDGIQIVEGLPKTRSGKILRRMLKKIANGETKDLGDTTTLADPSVLNALLNKETRP